MTSEGTQPARLAGAPSWLLGQASTFAHRLLYERFAADGMRPYHYRLLASLDEFGPASQASLGRSTGIDRSDVVAALNELAEKNLIERSPDPDDRRRNIITLTPDGAARLKQLDNVLAEIQDELTSPLSREERDHLTRLLTKLVTHHAARPS
jgi:DNA-binding MarR family transcriptional regulator